MQPTEKPGASVAAPLAGARNGRRKPMIRRYQQELRMLLALLAIGFVLSIVSPYFLRINNILNLMDQSVVVGIVAIGQTLVILTGGIDLAVGSLLGVTGVVMGVLMQHVGVVPAAIGGLLAGGLLGAFSGTLVAYGRLTPFVVTLGMMSVGRSLAYVLSGASSITSIPDSFAVLGNAFIGDILPLNFTILIILYGLTWYFLERTKPGRLIYALGSNEEATRLSGVKPEGYKLFVYTASGVMSAIAAAMLASRILSIDPIAGTALELDSIAAVVIGGTSLFGGRGSIVGTLIGVFTVVVIRNGLNLLGVSPYWQGTAIGLLIIGAVLMERVFSRRNG